MNGDSSIVSNPSGSALFFGLTAVYCFYQFCFPPLKWIEGVPIQKSNSILGFTDFTNEKVKRLLQESGPVAQFHIVGRQILQINDKELARIALRDVTGKGFFHNPTPKIVPSTTFSMDTNADWTQRRSTFRKAFSHLALKYHLPTVTRMNEKLLNHLAKCADEKKVAQMDDIFTHFTVGIICQVAFEMDIDVFDEDFSYADNLLKIISDIFQVRGNCALDSSSNQNPLYSTDGFEDCR
jgi:cytochrome P450